ncbi:Spindle associated [Cordyceps fumosorosea ARSEF 2679]|uniref:Spindle associated n=1 Tax=Cordyceps fumosorosea (strain ARSEF 2679) TaxID=1081104 RepID=A0A168ECM0_CORFA|nr:Spindle associated [Cordyceps fumosorosea ARSEF 2679]OAA73650.1 Spindle associated [Cordyceps fumosorosea ARSEF 2679]
MVQGGFGGVLDTPRTNLGDATYLSRGPDFADISQEASFHSPQKDSGNILQQLRNGRSNGNGVSIRTPRRDPLTDRNNLPPSIGGAEFTPLLKSATRNSVRQRGGKENGTVSLTPNLSRIDENDLTPVPRMDASMYSSSRNQSFLDHTIPKIDSSSVTSTPLAIATRRGGDKGPLQDGNQLSLREQENVIDKIEKENFGLKLKIHFLEDALRKAGPGFHEAALKENTELKVEKVTMQREVHRYKKSLVTAERELETSRRQILELQSRASQSQQDDGLSAEMESLQRQLDDKEDDIRDLRRQIAAGQGNQEQVESLQDNVEDLEADLRDKDRQLTEREDEAEDLKDKIEDAEARARAAEKRAQEAEENGQDSDELDEAKETIQDLEQNIRRLEEQVDELNEKLEAAATDKDRAERDLEELQEEMANKSVVTKGLSRQIDEKVTRLQDELDKAGEDYATLEKEYTAANAEIDELKAKVDELEHEQADLRQENPEKEARIEELEAELQAQMDEKDLIQTRHDTLSAESTALQREVQRLQTQVEELESSVDQERNAAVEIEKDLRRHQDELERLNDDISDLQAEIREKDNIYDNDSERWETEKQALEAERNRAEEKAAGLQRTVDRLREAEGSLSDRGSRLQDGLKMEEERHRSEEALMTRQIDDLQDALETRQKMLTDLRSELSKVRDDLRQAQVDYQTQGNKVISLEDQIVALRSRPTAVSTPARREGEALKRECESLREQLRTLRLSVEATRGASEGTPMRSSQTPTRLKWQLTDASTKLDKVSSEKKALEDSLSAIRAELRNTQNSLAEIKAERDELDSQLRRAKLHDNDTLRVDQERLDLRTAKLKLDGEVRRLRDENKALSEQRQSVEKSLESEIEKAAAEEDRLNQEIMQLQAKLRQASSAETADNSTTRRMIRDLERRVEDYQAQLASAQALLDGEGTSEVSIIRRDLTSARQKEVEFLQREAASKEVIKGLRREVADLESKLHDQQVSRMVNSPNSSQMANATYGGSQVLAEELQQQLDDAEDQRVVLEEFLEEARQQAEETAAQHAQSLQRLQNQLNEAIRDRDTVVAPAPAASPSSKSNNGRSGTSSKAARVLRRTQDEIENLEHDVRQQQALIEGLVGSEVALRRKLERTRSERAAYRVSAEKLGQDVAALRRGTGETEHEMVVRAAAVAAERHRKELRGLTTQMTWMQARWEREAKLRTDAAFAKRFLQLQLDIATACNKAQLRELEHIRTKILHSRKPLLLPGASSSNDAAGRKPTLRTFLVAARFVAKMRIAARQWAAQEEVRRRLQAAAEETRKAKRAKGLRVVRVDEEDYGAAA